MNQLNIFFEFVVFEALNPKFSSKIKNLSNNFLFKICILFIKLSTFRRKFSIVISGSQKAENYIQVCTGQQQKTDSITGTKKS